MSSQPPAKPSPPEPTVRDQERRKGTQRNEDHQQQHHHQRETPGRTGTYVILRTYFSQRISGTTRMRAFYYSIQVDRPKKGRRLSHYLFRTTTFFNHKNTPMSGGKMKMKMKTTLQLINLLLRRVCLCQIFKIYLCKFNIISRTGLPPSLPRRCGRGATFSPQVSPTLRKGLDSWALPGRRYLRTRTGPAIARPHMRPPSPDRTHDWLIARLPARLSVLDTSHTIQLARKYIQTLRPPAPRRCRAHGGYLSLIHI